MWQEQKSSTVTVIIHHWCWWKIEDIRLHKDVKSPCGETQWAPTCGMFCLHQKTIVKMIFKKYFKFCIHHPAARLCISSEQKQQGNIHKKMTPATSGQKLHMVPFKGVLLGGQERKVCCFADDLLIYAVYLTPRLNDTLTQCHNLLISEINSQKSEHWLKM